MWSSISSSSEKKADTTNLSSISSSPEKEAGTRAKRGVLKYFHVTLIGLLDDPKESCTDAKRIETCVAPRHIDASRDLLFSVQQTTSGIGHHRVKCLFWVGNQ